MEVKLDAGCEKLNQEVANGRATLLRVDGRSDYTFQNLTIFDMQKQLDKDD